MLVAFLIILFLIVLINIINEKTIKISSDIALVLFSFIIGAVIKILAMQEIAPIGSVVKSIAEYDIQEFLIEGILCYMLFSGASCVNFKRFVSNLKTISLLALLSTLISSFVYGMLFYGINTILHLGFTVWMCILLGCIVSPTDPIAATSILKKAGLSKNVSTVIEGESLFNDGTGVILFICIGNIINSTAAEPIYILIGKEIFGSIAIGIIISYILFKLVRITNNPMLQIFISLLDVTAAYVICEHLGCSGVIASVICGLSFSRKRVKYAAWFEVVDSEGWYEKFWEMGDTLFNSILFVFMGFFALNIPYHKHLVIFIISAIVINLIARFLGVGISTVIVGKDKIPNKYNIKEFTTLMTWSALKGGLSLALAFGTREFLPEDVYSVVLITTCVTMYFTIVIQGLTTQKIFKRVESWKAKRLS